MEFDIRPLIRPHILNLKPYSSARDEYTGKSGVFLDANENAMGSVVSTSHNRYPDPLQWAVKKELAQQKGITPEQIFLGNGSDEAIDLLIRAFCEPQQDEILIMPPTYGMYKVCADINHVAVCSVPLLPGFQMDEAGVRAAMSAHTKLVFVCSPNNPSGNLMSKTHILHLLEQVPGLLVVDEAYIDFSPENSLLSYLEAYPRLLILQTFSKAWGLANLRLGMAFAHPAIIQVLNKIKPPYNVNGLSQELALNALQNQARKVEMVTEILEQRSWLKKELEQLPMVVQVHPSETNFLLTHTTNANQLYEALIQSEIIVRNRSNVYLCEQCLRITVGTEAENKGLIEALWKLAK